MSTQTATALRVSQMIQADREAVFAAWTEPDLIKAWSCPPGASVVRSEVDLEVGGAYVLGMRGDDGASYTAFGTYREVVRPEKLVYTWDWEQSEHAVGETLVTVEFIERGDATEVVVTHERFPDAERTEGHRQSWTSCLAKLGTTLAGDEV